MDTLPHPAKNEGDSSGASPGGSSRSWIARRLRKWHQHLDMRVRRDRLKYAAEVAFWRTFLEESGGRFSNDHYRTLMLAMAGRNDAEFVRGRIVANFGCGPRGSLCWATAAHARNASRRR
jgi:hypothetical protein